MSVLQNFDKRGRRLYEIQNKDHDALQRKYKKCKFDCMDDITAGKKLNTIRQSKGLTILALYMKTGISTRTFSDYFSGKLSLKNIPADSAILLFDALDTPIFDFYDENFPFKEELSKAVEKAGKKKLSVSFGQYEDRLWYKISRYYYRKKITEAEREELKRMHDEAFYSSEPGKEFPYHARENAFLTYDEYLKYIKPIEMKLDYLSDRESYADEETKVYRKIVESDFTLTEVANLCEITRQHLKGCLDGRYKLQSLKIITALKLSFLLNLDFREIFGSKLREAEGQLRRVEEINKRSIMRTYHDTDINRFIEAQKYEYEQALKEIKGGRKIGHWIWYIFPQVEGLGVSSISEYYAIKSLSEAKAYMENETLRSHLLEISEALYEVFDRDILSITGYPDNLKVRSSMTLFSETAPEYDIFEKVLNKYYAGQKDEATVDKIREWKANS